MSEEQIKIAPWGIAGNDPSFADRRYFETQYGVFPYKANIPRSQEEHRAMRDSVIRRVRLSAGLEPGVEFLPFEPKVTSPRNVDGVTISDVAIETLPGLRLTGNFFTPEKFTGKLPAILCPHGHWVKGRVDHKPTGGVIMRCMELARLGFAVFAYDMIGYNDNNAMPHRWEREAYREACFNGVSPFGLQTANSMRAVDFLVSHPAVDPSRIGCTGASGGGSQTWFIALLDPRVKVVCPVCMLSLHFMGGCTCEEGPLLRTRGLTSFDMVAAIAPRPILLPGVTGDWTNLNPDYEVPKLKEIYKLYHAEENVESFFYDDGHNYNQRTRQHVYAWFVRQLQGKDAGDIIEESTDKVPAPEQLWHGGTQPEAPTKESFDKAYALLKKHYTSNLYDWGNDFTLWQSQRCDLLRQMLESDTPTTDVVPRSTHGNWQLPEGELWAMVVSRRGMGDAINTFRLRPADKMSCDNAILYPVEKECLDYFNEGPKAGETAEFFKLNAHTWLMELFGSGATAANMNNPARNDNDPLDPACNDSYYCMRVQDIITNVVMLKERKYKNITLAGSSANALAVLGASALLGCRTVVDLSGVTDECWKEKLNYQPLMGKMGGLKTLALLNVRRNVTFCGVSGELRETLLSLGANVSDKTLMELL